MEITMPSEGGEDAFVLQLIGEEIQYNTIVSIWPECQNSAMS
jgi:hypothetical protein